MLHDKIQELEDSNTDREKEVLVNQIDTLKCVLGHLFNLKYDKQVRAIEIADANQQAKRGRKKLVKIQDAESEISAQIRN